MVRQLYPGTFVQLSSGLPGPGLAVSIWTDLITGTNVTSQLLAADGVSVFVATTDGNGNLQPFRGPDGFSGNLFVDSNVGIRYQLASPTAWDALVAQVAAILLQIGSGGGGGVTDHGALSGLLDDDHPQYHNDARGDFRYYLKAAVDSAIASAVAAASVEDRKRANHSGTQTASSISDFNAAVAAAGGGGGGGGVTDHGALSGLLDDDHPQYLTNGRGDARYYTQALVDSKTAAAATASSAADRDRTNHTGSQSIGSVTSLQAALDAKTPPMVAYMAGTVATTVGALRLRLPRACVLDSVTLAVGTAPTGRSLVVDVNVNGTTIFATAANKPTITAGAFGSTTASTNASTTSFSAGDYLTVDVDQVGSTVAGADLVVSVWLRF